MQMGGSDQWGNIVNGVELTRRMDGVEVFGLTTPLLTTADGQKMGKTAQGRRLAQRAQLPSYDFWQVLAQHRRSRRRPFLRLFTDLPLDEIAASNRSRREINEAKIVLANEVTSWSRRESARAAEATAAQTFAGGGLGETCRRSRSAGEASASAPRSPRSASPPRTARPSARSPRAPSGSTTCRRTIPDLLLELAPARSESSASGASARVLRGS
jgi:tyrosyl-tRNA synthetase